MTPIELLKHTSDLGITLTVREEELIVHPARLCTPALAASLRERKPRLMKLMGLRFLIVKSALLNETIFFAENDRVRLELCAAGAQESSIYIHDELRELVAHTTSSDIPIIHAAKRTFKGRIQTPRES